MKKTDPSKNTKNQIAFSLLMLLLLGTAAIMYFNYYQSKIGPEQPIPFSHRLHAEKKDISCVICHEGALSSARAGIPPLETCMLCHDRVIIHHPEIEKLRAHYANNTPVQWTKVYEIPDFVYFNHGVHIFRKIDCAQCHGNVKQMDRIERTHELKMQFCIQCHRENNATTDCFSCHR